jgi:hypothetical protein
MPDNTDGFAGRLPDGLFPAFLQPFFEDAWSIAVAGYVLALWVYLLGSWLAVLILGDWTGFRGFLLALFAESGAFPFPFIAPMLLFAVAIVVLAAAGRPGAAPSSRARMLTDAALLGTALLAVVEVLGNVIGFIVDLSFVNNGFGDFVDAATLHIGAFIIAVVAGLWAMGVLNARRSPS